MSRLSVMLTLLVLCAVYSVSMARNTEPVPNDQQRLKRQTEDPTAPEESDDENDIDSRSDFPVNCDWVNTPKYSCYNCYTQLVCKSTGGKLKNCNRYCNNGQCSEMPSQACRNNFNGELSNTGSIQSINV